MQVKGSDWTKLLADPDLVAHIGELLEVYRTTPPDSRDRALVEAMRKIKEESGRIVAGSQTIPETSPALTTPPFEPDIFTPAWGDDRRRFPRMRCFVAVELSPENSPVPVWGNLANISLGGCLIETATPLSPGVNAEIGLWVASGKIWIKGLILNGIITGTKPCFGIRIKFDEVSPTARETLRQFLQYVDTTTKSYRKQHGYVQQMKS